MKNIILFMHFTIKDIILQDIMVEEKQKDKGKKPQHPFWVLFLIVSILSLLYLSCIF